MTGDDAKDLRVHLTVVYSRLLVVDNKLKDAREQAFHALGLTYSELVGKWKPDSDYGQKLGEYVVAQLSKSTKWSVVHNAAIMLVRFVSSPNESYFKAAGCLYGWLCEHVSNSDTVISYTDSLVDKIDRVIRLTDNQTVKAEAKTVMLSCRSNNGRIVPLSEAKDINRMLMQDR